MMIQMKLAEKYAVGLVCEYLVGYRRLDGQMSSDVEMMRKCA